MRAAAGLYAADTLSWHGIVARQKLGVFFGINVVGHNCHIDRITQVLAKP
jgi:hypothetical protein